MMCGAFAHQKPLELAERRTVTRRFPTDLVASQPAETRMPKTCFSHPS